VRDVVVMVRQGRDFEELRYTLRSIAANVPHNRVWIYGAKPKWLSAAAIHHEVRQGPVGHANTARILAAIATNRGLTDEWLWWHDDMYALTPVDEVPRLYRCTWGEWTSVKRKGPYGPAKTQATVDVLAAFGKVPEFCYELHVPMVVDRDAMADMVAAVTTWRPDALTHVQKRSLYGNWVGYGGIQAADVKTSGDLPDGSWASSSDDGFRTGWQQLRALFPDPSPYEQPPPRRIPDAVRLMAGHLAGGT
jgi:hypothetical protein